MQYNMLWKIYKITAKFLASVIYCQSKDSLPLKKKHEMDQMFSWLEIISIRE